MGERQRLLYGATFGLSILADAFLSYNMLAISLHQQEILYDRGPLTGAEWMMLVGFGVVVLFDIVGAIWAWSQIRQAGRVSVANGATLAFGALCPVLLLGAKVMLDEIARESRSGMEVEGEWAVFYALLSVQWAYSTWMLLRMLRSSKTISRYLDRTEGGA